MGLVVQVLLWVVFFFVLYQPLKQWVIGSSEFDKAAMEELIDEADVFRKTLPEMVSDYQQNLDKARQANPGSDLSQDPELKLQADKIQEHLKALGNPTKMYSGQMLLFPNIYRLQVEVQLFKLTDRSFDSLRKQDVPEAVLAKLGDLKDQTFTTREELSSKLAEKLANDEQKRFGPLLLQEAYEPSLITWDSGVPRHPSQYQDLKHPLGSGAWLHVQYQLHAYNKQQRQKRTDAMHGLILLALAGSGIIMVFVWMYLVLRREQERRRLGMLARQQVDQAERLRLQEELPPRSGRKHEDAERDLLEQRLATQAAESQALELKSQLYASIGIMAGSYAHNIKNLLVRPNDLLRRCLEADGISPEQEQMLQEVRHTLGTVTERLQQILRTVRRDPSRAEMAPVDLNELAAELQRTWFELAREKWKLTLTLEPASEPLWIEGDLSHLQQSFENLIFNARDATFEMRGYLREQAHCAEVLQDHERRQALIDAAGWKGTVTVRTRREGDQAILEIQDNGIGMSEEVRRRCTETHFSTKRDNAIFQGISTGMGLGLSFVVVILEHHRAGLEITSTPLGGTTFRISFPLTVCPESPSPPLRGRGVGGEGA